MSAAPTTAQAAEPPAPDEQAVAERSWLRRLTSHTAFYVFLVDLALIVFFYFASNGGVFLSTDNVQAMLGNGAEGLLLACGLTFMIAAGVFDLSLGANLILSSVLGAQLLAHMTDAQTLTASTGAILICVVACLAIGALVGVVNGLIITVLRVNSLIATLGTLGICTGLALVLSQGSDVSGLPTNIQSSFGLATVLGIPYPAFVALAVLAVMALILRYARFGSRTLAIGSNRVAAERAGLRVRGHIVALTTIAGLLAGLSGFIDVARFDTTNVSGHTLDALAAVTAVVVGGTPLEGGRASMLGTLWGAVLAVILLNGLVVINVQAFYQQIATGVILIVAVTIDSYRNRRKT